MFVDTWKKEVVEYLLNIFLEFQKTLQSPQSFRLFFQVFTNTPVLPEIAKHISRMSVKLVDIFVWLLIKALQSPQSFRIFFQVITNNPVLPDVAEHFSRISRSHTKPPKLQNIFQVFTNTPVLPEIAKHFSRISTSHIKSPKLQNIVSSIYKHSSTFWSC